MRITDELREYSRAFHSIWLNSTNQTISFTTSDMPPAFDSIRMDSRILAIADRIDAEYEALCDQLDTSERQKESYREDFLAANRQIHASYNDGFDNGFASADDWLGQHEDAMAEHGWYRALDADKQPIKFGDEVEHNGVVANVLGITFHGTTPPTVCIVRGDCWVEADELRHHAPTVEDVLREFAYVGIRIAAKHGIKAGEIDFYADEEAVAEYAAKLRLAGDAE